ncbi:MAG TPA: hypothetical protein VGD66_01120 [Allosphingosinicella sp.]|jgi:hypothetical protein
MRTRRHSPGPDGRPADAQASYTGLRVAEEAEREGLDLADHGERAYNY